MNNISSLVFNIIKKKFSKDFAYCNLVTRRINSNEQNPLNEESGLSDERFNSDEKNPFDAESKLSSYRFKNGYDRKH